MLGPSLLIAIAASTTPLVAQQGTDTLDLRRIFSATEEVNGRRVVDTLPELMVCPRFDSRSIRGDETTFSFERRPTIDANMPPVRVTIEFVVGTNGRIERRTARVVRSSEERLSRSFEYWVMGCRFHPGKVGDRPVRVRMEREWEIQPTP
jgi:hypothetical protein